MRRRVFRGKRKNTPRRGRKVRFGRRARGGNRTNSVSVRGVQVPDTTLMKLKYCSNVRLDSSTSAPGFYIFSGNSLYDPDVTGTGHQPLGLDQWAAFYLKYCVLASKIKVIYSITTGGTAATQNAKFVLMPLASDVDSSVLTSMTDLASVREQNYAKFRQGNIVGGASGFRINHYMSTHKIDGVSKTKIAVDDEYMGLTGGISTGTDPGNNWRWVLAVQPVDPASTITGYAAIEITYYAKLYDRKPLSQS